VRAVFEIISEKARGDSTSETVASTTQSIFPSSTGFAFTGRSVCIPLLPIHYTPQSLDKRTGSARGIYRTRFTEQVNHITKGAAPRPFLAVLAPLLALRSSVQLSLKCRRVIQINTVYPIYFHRNLPILLPRHQGYIIEKNSLVGSIGEIK